MNIPDNIAWLEDLAMHSGLNGNTVQEQKLWVISAWIRNADELLGQQSEVLNQLKERCEELQRQSEWLQNRLARFGG